MAIRIASAIICVYSPDYPKRWRIVWPVAVFSVANVCR